MADQKPIKPPPDPVRERGGEALVLERVTQRVKPPQMYQVIMFNDDFTPMEFVVFVLQEFFGKDQSMAEQIMYQIHLRGKATCGVYSKDVATTKMEQVLLTARQAGHPLQCLTEPIE